MRPTHVLAALGGLAMLAGCSPATPTTTPTPVVSSTPWYYCTPDGASSGAPCSKEEYEAQVAREELYKEAERVYRSLTAAEKEAFLKGAPADEEILRHTIGEARELVIQSHADGTRLIEGDVVIEWIRRSPELKRADDAVVITICTDSTNAIMETPGQAPTAGIIGVERAYYVNQGGQLKITLFEAKEVEQC